MIKACDYRVIIGYITQYDTTDYINRIVLNAFCYSKVYGNLLFLGKPKYITESNTISIIYFQENLRE